MSVVQAFKPYFDEWRALDFDVSPVFRCDNEFDCIYCILPKQKEAAQYQLALSANSLKQGGLLLAIAENEAGGKRLQNWFKELGFDPNSASKNKCKIVWANKENLLEEKISEWIKNGSEKIIETSHGDFYTKPGIYGWKKIDLGSQLLLNNLPDNIEGNGADFGCGYGFLSRAILSQSEKIKKLYAIDADYDALECTRKNLLNFTSKVEFMWEDLTRPLKEPLNLDWVVMNPPFHEGKEIHADIGQSFIQRSAENIRSKGVLYMVANAHLPYEKVLESCFTQVEKLSEKEGFKVFKAIR
jgi:16S rRNA (guanine1207-N2)-methyltransferase